MQEQNLFKKYTIKEIFDELDVIKCFEQKDYKIKVGEVTKHQENLYKELGVLPPNSLQ